MQNADCRMQNWRDETLKDNVSVDKCFDFAVRIVNLCKFLNNEKKEYSFTLNYFATANKEPHIDYTSDFSNAVTCGILEFTAVLEAEFIEELEDGVYD
jgi:hypothetical protein